MNEINIEERNRYYKELSIRLAGEGYGAGPMKDGLLPVRWLGEPLFRVTAGGGAQFREEELDRDGGRAAFDRAVDIAREVKQYMRLMDAAPVLKADGLDETYKLLADFPATGWSSSHGSGTTSTQECGRDIITATTSPAPSTTSPSAPVSSHRQWCSARSSSPTSVGAASRRWQARTVPSATRTSGGSASFRSRSSACPPV